MKRLLLFLFIIPGIILAYGYWHSITHGSAHFDLVFKSADKKKQWNLSKAEVFFKNIDGVVLAKGLSDEKGNFIHLIHPKSGDCHELIKGISYRDERELWQECYKEQSIWIAKWIKDVRQVEVKHEDCPSAQVPIVISEYNSEWPLWWVPLPHVGGLPYSYFRASVIIEEKDCKK